MWGEWQGFSRDEEREMGATARPLTEPGERTCPRCGRTTIRYYCYDLSRGGVGITYAWCYPCRRYKAWRGDSLAVEYDYNDPLLETRELARIRDQEGARMLEKLQGLWDEGVLPQTFTPKKR